jgi:hypothetical protein
MNTAEEILDLADGEYAADVSDVWHGMISTEERPLVAGAFPVKPTRAWFDNPRLRTLTPMTVQSDGRVFGHIAAWHTSHIGMSAGVKPPKSKSKYAFFATGVLETAEGDFVDVGQITLAGGHASLDVTIADAVAHYDNTQSAVMDVTIGEDRSGIWVAGALRPDVTDTQLRAIRASSVSGDWRPINNSLELVAVCAVNVPGFPIPRARVAAGAPLALVAAGVEPLIALARERDIAERAPIVASFAVDQTARLEALESVIASICQQRREEIGTLVASAKRAKMQDRIATHRRKKTLTASLRDRVHSNTDPVSDRAAQLRARVHN